jgi:hypothetical protein
MAQSRPVAATLLWLCLLSFLAALVTAAAFYVFIPGPDREDQGRKLTFYVAMGLIIGAEFVFFSHLAFSKVAEARGGEVSTATRFQVQGAIVLWLLATVVAAVMAVDPERSGTIKADKILVIDLILTFLFFAFAYFMYSKDIEVGRSARQLAAARNRVQLCVPDLEQVMRAVGELGRQFPEHAVLADQTGKKVDTVRSALEGVVVSERGLGGEALQQIEAQIQQQIDQLSSLSRGLTQTSSGPVPQALRGIGEQAEAILTLVRRRERALTS